MAYRWFHGGALLSLLSLLTCCSDRTLSSTQSTAASTWVVAWGNSPENALPSSTNQGGEEQSFRFLFLPTVTGTEERVHFSNYFGTTPLTIGSARLAVAPGGSAAIDPTHDAPLLFSGSTSVTIPAGQSVVSDPVMISYTFGQKMAVSMYLTGSFPALTQHNSQVTTNYAAAAGAGDTTTDSSGASFATAVTEWYLLSGMDVYGSYQGTVALFGSSSIDGHNSNYGNTSAYPVANLPVAGQDNDRPSDWLARQLNAAGYRVGVLNAGVLGDPAGPNPQATPANGIAPGVDRMGRDVLQQPGIQAVVIYLGSVDIRSTACESAPSVEAALANMVAHAQAAGVRVVLGTLPPAAFCTNPASANYGPFASQPDPFGGDINPGPENPGSTQRRLVNTWIRTAGAQLPGVVGIADFDLVLADPAHPDYLLPSLNSGDNYHPNGVGYGVQSTAIVLPSLLGP